MTQLLAHQISGGSSAGSTTSTIESRNPSNSDDLVTIAPVGAASDVAMATDAAAKALPGWREMAGPGRAAILYAWGEAIAGRHEEFAQAIAREVGKPISEARGEVGRAVVICRYYAGEAVRDVGEVIPATTANTTQFTLRDPVGVVGLITPWNFPLAIPLWKAAPALAFGNSVVLKPSEHSPAIAMMLAETAAVAGLPAGTFNVVFGDGSTGAALVADPRVNAVSFTGSQRSGAKVQVAAAARNIRCQTEMGGKNIVIVAADGDLERAALLTAAGAFRFAGQKCTATSRVVVDKRVVSQFTAKLEAATEGLLLGSVTEASTAIGPMVSAGARDTALAAVSGAPSPPIIGGHQPTGAEWDKGHWLAPCVLAMTDTGHSLVRDELFAPILTLLECDGIDEALSIANDTQYGLSASLFTADLGSAFHYIRQMEAGLVRVNGDTTGVDPHAPFGGVKGSSSGSREQGRAARDFYTETRTIQIHA